MFTPLAIRPAQPMYSRCAPEVALPDFSCPDSSKVATTSGWSPSCSTTNRRTTPLAVSWSHTASFSSRCVRSGVASPTCSAICHPFLRGTSASNAPRYLPACSYGSDRAKHDSSRPCSSTRLDAARRPSTMAAAAPHCCHCSHDDHHWTVAYKITRHARPKIINQLSAAALLASEG